MVSDVVVTHPAAVLSLVREQDAVLGDGNCETEENHEVRHSHHHPHNEKQLDRYLLQPTIISPWIEMKRTNSMKSDAQFGQTSASLWNLFPQA